jgi:hypothetical protein
MNLDKIITEAINKVVKEAIVDKFTPYSPEQAKINKMGIGRMGNPSYDNAKKADTAARPVNYKSIDDWRANYKPKGITWSQYQKM